MPLAGKVDIRKFLTTKCTGSGDGQHVPMYSQDGSYTESYWVSPTEDGHVVLDDLCDGSWNDIYDSSLYCRYCQETNPVHLGFNEYWETY